MKQMEMVTATQLINKNELKQLSALNIYKSLGALFFDWLVIVAAATMYVVFPGIITYLVAWVLIGSRMYALYSLLHDGLHYLIFPNRKVNDWICRIFLAWPQFIELQQMRKVHLAHHQFLKTSQDPEQAHLNYSEFNFPQSRFQVCITFLKDITGLNFLIYNFQKAVAFCFGKKHTEVLNITDASRGGRFNLYRYLYYFSIISIAWFTGTTTHLLVLWVVPYMTIYQALNRLRLSTEHFHLDKDTPFQTRTVTPGFVESFFLSPHHLGYHTEHHICPSVPFYNLPALQRTFESNDLYRHHFITHHSYYQVIKRYVR